MLGSIGKRHDLLIRQGAGFGPYLIEVRTASGAARDITGWTAEGSLRRHASSTVALVDFEFDLPAPTLGQLRFWIDAEDTLPDALPCGESDLDKESLYYWDFDLITSAGTRIPLLYGSVRVKAKGDVESGEL